MSTSEKWCSPQTWKIIIFISILIFVLAAYLISFDYRTPPAPTQKSKSKQKTHHGSNNACGVPVQNEPAIKVADHNAYMIGSYVDHRFDVRKIRTIAVVLRSENVDFYCLLCCSGKNISVAAQRDIHTDHFNFDYGTADITCDVPNECTTPQYVGITSKTHDVNGTIWKIEYFQPVQNQRIKTQFPYEFTVCISVMYEYKDVLGFVQAMEMFKILGVQKVAIYQTSCHPDVQKVLDYYVKTNFVEIIPWTISQYLKVAKSWKKSESPAGDLEFFGQIAALNDCLYRYMYQSHFLALQDTDEFILPLKEENWTMLIPQLEQKYSNYAGFEFQNNVFPNSIYKDSKYKDLWNNVRGINLLQHVQKIPQNLNEFNNFKIIVNPRLVFKTTVHGILEPSGGTIRVDSNIARMYHISHNKPSESESLIEDTHLWDYADKLIPAVSKVLQNVFGIN